MAQFLVIVDGFPQPPTKITGLSAAVGGAVERLIELGECNITLHKESEDRFSIAGKQHSAIITPTRGASENLITRPPGRRPFDDWYGPKVAKYFVKRTEGLKGKAYGYTYFHVRVDGEALHTGTFTLPHDNLSLDGLSIGAAAEKLKLITPPPKGTVATFIYSKLGFRAAKFYV